jgi:aconitate hydratase
VLRHAGAGIVRTEDVATLTAWRPGIAAEAEVPFMPTRVVLQDFTGVPAIVDLAAMRDAMADLGGDPARVNPLVPADLVIDHSVQVDMFGNERAFAFNVEREYERNGERYQLLRWAQTAFRDLRVVPPGTGIVHQVNLEYLATVVADGPAPDGTGRVAYPDTLVGTDSHTTMINGLGVLGYGVGGIEAEAVLLGQPLYQPMPRIVGVRLSGELPRGSTATDLVLVVTEMLRSYGVVGAFVEFTGDGLAGLALADRATISNMSPEFGATATLFPIDDETLAYLRLTGRRDERVALVERYAKEQGLWRLPGQRLEFDDLLVLDLSRWRRCPITSGQTSRTGYNPSSHEAASVGRSARSRRRRPNHFPRATRRHSRARVSRTLRPLRHRPDPPRVTTAPIARSACASATGRHRSAAAPSRSRQSPRARTRPTRPS